MSAWSDDHFEALYAHDDDPWHLATTPYELEKYRQTVDVVRSLRPHRLFEPGCSIGVLTDQLTTVADHVVAMDVSRVAVQRAAARAPSADVRRGRVPQDWADGTFDLVVVSELLYYLDDAQRSELVRRCRDSIGERGAVVAVHYRPPFTGSTVTADTAHDELEHGLGRARRTVVSSSEYLLEAFVPRPG